MENNASTKKQVPAFLILGIIALVAALVLALTNAITKGPIAEHAIAALREAFSIVMPADEYEEITVPGSYDVRSLYEAKTNGETVGYCVTAAGKGYNGDVAVTLGVGTDGLVTGAVVGDTSFSETPGFGARAKEPAFQEQFVGLDAVNGGTFDALSGATVTSTAVLYAVNQALPCVDELALQQTPAASPLVAFGAPAEKPAVEAAELTGNVLEASAKGFASDVQVQVTVDGSGAVSGINIDSSGETEGFGQRLMSEPEFGEQFIGQTGPFAIGENIDVLSGASVTSGAVVEAVNAALASSGDALEASAKGFASDVHVKITLDDAGAVSSINIDSSGETEGFGQRLMSEPEFGEQFIGQTGPFAIGENIDVLSGASVTSGAVVEAVNAALAAPTSASVELPVTPLLSTDDVELGVRADGAAIIAPVEGYTGELNVAINVENGQVTAAEFKQPGEIAGEAAEVLTNSKVGFEGDVKVSVTLNEDGTIATLKVSAPDETPGLGKEAENEKFTSQFIGKSAPFTLGENVDGVSGATITSKAVVEALNELLPAAEEAAEAEVLTNSKVGFEGDVKVSVTLNEDGTIATLEVSAPDETPGLGKEAENEKFTSQFIGKAAPFSLGENVDGVSGATITSKAVIEALNELLPAAEEPAEAEVLTNSKVGFEGDVKVSVTLNEDGTIATLSVEAPDETPGLGKEAEKEYFTSQFIGKAAPFTLGENVDGVSGATITSKAVVEALNELLPAAEESADAEVLTKSKVGFEGEVKVSVTLNEDGTIATLEVSAPDETPGLGKEAEKEYFTSQFIGKSGPFTLRENVDGVSGATITSKAVIEALNELLGD